MLWSKTCDYALQAIVYVASQPEDVCVRSQDVAAYLYDVPSPYLSKILKELAGKGILQSFKGRGGGFLLAPGIRESGLLEMVERIEGESFGKGCVLGLASCADETACPAHRAWSPIKNQLLDLLNKQTIGYMADAVRAGHYDLRLLNKVSLRERLPAAIG